MSIPNRNPNWGLYETALKNAKKAEFNIGFGILAFAVSIAVTAGLGIVYDTPGVAPFYVIGQISIVFSIFVTIYLIMVFRRKTKLEKLAFKRLNRG